MGAMRLRLSASFLFLATTPPPTTTTTTTVLVAARLGLVLRGMKRRSRRRCIIDVIVIPIRLPTSSTMDKRATLLRITRGRRHGTATAVPTTTTGGGGGGATF